VLAELRDFKRRLLLKSLRLLMSFSCSVISLIIGTSWDESVKWLVAVVADALI
jgi:hypothetical protein